MDRNLQLLGIARKAGFLAIGGEAASASAKSGSAKAIITAGDASEGAKRRARRDAEFCGAAFADTSYTKFELGNITGRGSPGTLAVTDSGLAAGFLKGLAEDDPERYGDMAGRLPGAESLPNRERKMATGKRRTAR